MNIKLIVTDLDGTFLNSKGQIPVENLQMVQKISGDHPTTKVVFATGTGPERAMKYARACGLDQQQENYMICYNGSAIIKYGKNNQEVISQTTLSFAQGQDIINIAKKYQTELQIYDLNDNKVLWLDNIEVFNATKLAEKQSNMRDEPFLYKGILFFKHENNSIDQIIKELKSDYPLLEISRSRLSNSHDLFKSYPAAPPVSIEINPIGANKGLAISKLCEMFNISVEHEVIACGDEMNDKTMLETVGCSVAVANANLEIKKLAKFATKTNNAAGFAQAVQDYAIEERNTLTQEFYSLVNNFEPLFVTTDYAKLNCESKTYESSDQVDTSSSYQL